MTDAIKVDDEIMDAASAFKACQAPGLEIPVLDPCARRVFFCVFPGYRERHWTFFVKPLTDAGWNVVPVVIDRADVIGSVRKAAAEHGIPDALIQWEEHGCARATAA